MRHLIRTAQGREPRRERGLQAKGEGAEVVVLSEESQRMRAEGPLQEPELLMQTVNEGKAGREAGEMGKRTMSGESKGAVRREGRGRILECVPKGRREPTHQRLG